MLSTRPLLAASSQQPVGLVYDTRFPLFVFVGFIYELDLLSSFFRSDPFPDKFDGCKWEWVENKKDTGLRMLLMYSYAYALFVCLFACLFVCQRVGFAGEMARWPENGGEMGFRVAFFWCGCGERKLAKKRAIRCLEYTLINSPDGS